MTKQELEKLEEKIKRIVFWIIFIPLLLFVLYFIGFRCLEAPIYYFIDRENGGIHGEYPSQ